MDKMASTNPGVRPGLQMLNNFDVYAKKYWYWIGVAALAGYVVLLNCLFTLSLMYLNSLGKKQARISEDEANENDDNRVHLPRADGNDTILIMDEPTSGLDARATAIVMRAVRNTVDAGRTVVCTSHQPSIDIFECFDELELMKRGQLIYAGPLGQDSHKIIEYFERVTSVAKIKEKYNTAIWMLEASSIAAEVRLGMDFAEHYKSSPLA